MQQDGEQKTAEKQTAETHDRDVHIPNPRAHLRRIVILLDDPRWQRHQHVAQNGQQNDEKNASGGARSRHWHIIDRTQPSLHSNTQSRDGHRPKGGRSRSEIVIMKAAYINQPGPPENIVVGDLPTHEPTSGQVLVRVRAAAVNPIDTYVRSGMVKMNIPLPYIVGADLAGVVEKLGPDAKQFKVGDRVWGSDQGLMGRQGTFAEYAAVDESWLYPIPNGASDEAAA